MKDLTEKTEMEIIDQDSSKKCLVAEEQHSIEAKSVQANEPIPCMSSCYHKKTEALIAQIEEATKLGFVVDYEDFYAEIDSIRDRLGTDPIYSSTIVVRRVDMMDETIYLMKESGCYDCNSADFICFERNDKVDFCFRNVKHIENATGKSILVKAIEVDPEEDGGYVSYIDRKRSPSELSRQLEGAVRFLTRLMEEEERKPWNRFKRYVPNVAIAVVFGYVGFMIGRRWKK